MAQNQKKRNRSICSDECKQKLIASFYGVKYACTFALYLIVGATLYTRTCQQTTCTTATEHELKLVPQAELAAIELLTAKGYNVEKQSCTTAYWTMIDALYFMVVSSTTTGFGDLTPTSRGMMLFTVFQTLVGILLIAGAWTEFQYVLMKAKTAKRAFEDSRQASGITVSWGCSVQLF